MLTTVIDTAKASLHALHGTIRAPLMRARSLAGEEGVVSAEYGILLALVAMAVLAAAALLGLAVVSLFQTGASGIPNA